MIYTITEGFQQNIQNWVSIDNKIKKLQQDVKTYRNHKHKLTNDIFTYAESNNLENAIIQISDGKLKFQNVKQSSPLTFKLVEECLMDIIKNEEQVKQLIKYIKSKREHKFNYDIKRTYK